MDFAYWAELHLVLELAVSRRSTSVLDASKYHSAIMSLLYSSMYYQLTTTIALGDVVEGGRLSWSKTLSP